MAHGWDVFVYCQETGEGQIREEKWKGVVRVVIPEPNEDTFGTIRFDYKSVCHAAAGGGLCLTLGYNTGIFTSVLRRSRLKTFMNMDGVEWSRRKWSFPAKAWLYINEWLGARLNHVLIADHPEISVHLQRHTSVNKIKIIPYGAPIPAEADPRLLEPVEIGSERFGVVIARPEPENSIFEIVQAWSKERRNAKLVVLGAFLDHVPYHQKVKAAASDEIVFPGAIYEKGIVNALRQHALVYLHGHQVGGTNPSLVEALSFGSPVIAHDNRFNRWVAGSNNRYFSNVDDCSHLITQVLSDNNLRVSMSDSSRLRHLERFLLEDILNSYLALLSRHGYRGQLGMPQSAVETGFWGARQ